MPNSAARRRFLVIHNPLAGRGRHDVLADTLAALGAEGAVSTVVSAQTYDEIRAAAADAVRGGDCDAVVAAGGDGTIRAAATVLAGGPLPLGVIPLGTGNVLATELGLPRAPRAIARMLRDGPATDLGCGRADAEPFLLMVSAGFDAAVVRRFRPSPATKRALGQLAYAWPILAELSGRPTPFEVSIDGRRTDCTWLVVANARHYAGRFVIAPDRSITDPGFTALIVTTTSRRGLLRVMLDIAAGRPPPQDLATRLPCRQAAIHDTRGVAVQLDGDLVAATSLSIGSEKIDLSIIVPPR